MMHILGRVFQPWHNGHLGWVITCCEGLPCRFQDVWWYSAACTCQECSQLLTTENVSRCCRKDIPPQLRAS